MNNKYLITVLSSLVFLAATVSCIKKNEFEAEEQAQIDEYLAKHTTMNFEKKASGLYYLELVAGTGSLAVKYDTAYVRYTGKLLDGTVFDTNVGSSSNLEVIVGTPSIIQGFNEGLTYMAVGGKSMFLMPSSLAYGSYGNYYGGIPGYTPLLFEVEMVQLKKGKGN
jgi:FKBP-type peptidyl-prolyl cis-trans isomerase